MEASFRPRSTTVTKANVTELGGLFDERGATADDELLTPVACQQQLKPLCKEFVVIDDRDDVGPCLHGRMLAGTIRSSRRMIRLKPIAGV